MFEAGSTPDRWAGILTIAVCAALALVPFHTHVLNHDISWWLWIGEQTLAGASLYSDIIEVNPPLIIWLTLPAVGLSELTGLPAYGILPVLFVAVGLGVLSGAHRMLRGVMDSRLAARVAAALAIPVFVVPGPEFGQRPHLMLLFALPYLVIASRRMVGHPPSPSARAAAAAVAALGFAIKPHYILLWVGTETLVALSRRRWKEITGRESRVIAAILALYWITVLILTPAYLGLAADAWLLHRMFTHRPVLELLVRPEVGLAILALALWALARGGLAKEHEALVRVFAWGTIPMTLSAISQAKGYDYHFVPITMLAVAAGLSTLLGAWGNGPSRWRALVILAAITLTVAAAGRPVQWTLNVAGSGARTSEAVFVQQLASLRDTPGEPLLVLSTDMVPAFPLVTYSERTWALRVPSLWFMVAAAGTPPEIASRDVVAGARAAAARWEARVAADAAAACPRELFIQEPVGAARLTGRDFDVKAALSVHATFARLMSVYEPGEVTGDLRTYRRAGPCPPLARAPTR